jgi:hypothetical protein
LSGATGDAEIWRTERDGDAPDERAVQVPIAEDPPAALTHASRIHRERLVALIAFGPEYRFAQYLQTSITSDPGQDFRGLWTTNGADYTEGH